MVQRIPSLKRSARKKSTVITHLLLGMVVTQVQNCATCQRSTDTLWRERQYYASWFLYDCWDHGGDDDHCRIFDTREQYEIHKPRHKMLWRNFPFWCFWIYHMLWSALLQIICALLRVMGTFLNLRSRMSPLNMKDINELCSGSSALERLEAWVETGAGMILKMKYWKWFY